MHKANIFDRFGVQGNGFSKFIKIKSSIFCKGIVQEIKKRIRRVVGLYQPFLNCGSRKGYGKSQKVLIDLKYFISFPSNFSPSSNSHNIVLSHWILNKRLTKNTLNYEGITNKKA